MDDWLSCFAKEHSVFDIVHMHRCYFLITPRWDVFWGGFICSTKSCHPDCFKQSIDIYLVFELMIQYKAIRMPCQEPDQYRAHLWPEFQQQKMSCLSNMSERQPQTGTQNPQTTATTMTVSKHICISITCRDKLWVDSVRRSGTTDYPLEI